MAHTQQTLTQVLFSLLAPGVPPSKRCQTPFKGNSIYKFININTVYLLLRDAKLLLRIPLTYKLHTYKVYFLLGDVKLLLRDSILQVIHKYSVPLSDRCQTPFEGFH